MQILCVGGPKDGERVELSKNLIASGHFSIMDYSKADASRNIAGEQFDYDIVRYCEDNEEYRIARPSGGAFKLLAALLDGYRVAK